MGNSSGGTLELGEEKWCILAEVGRLGKPFVQQGRERLKNPGCWIQIHRGAKDGPMPESGKPPVRGLGEKIVAVGRQIF